MDGEPRYIAGNRAFDSGQPKGGGQFLNFNGSGGVIRGTFLPPQSYTWEEYPPMQTTLPDEILERQIFLIRGQRVMLDSHLAKLYGVLTKNLNKAANRNLERFPEDFMFRLSRQEYLSVLRFQTGTLEQGRYSKYLPFVFTEQGVAMLSSVLRSKRAVQVNVGIMRAFVKLRRLATSYPRLARRLDELESKYDAQFGEVFAAIRGLMDSPEEPKPRIGFKT